MKKIKITSKSSFVIGLGIYMIAGHGAFAQNTSSNANSNPISGINNCAFHINALNNTTTGQFNVAMGPFALISNTSGSHNIALGSSALGYNASGSRNTACGYAANGNNTTGSDNSSLGYYALASNNTGFGNCAFGKSSLYSNLTGAYNIAIGFEALQYNSSGSSNLAMGYQALNISNGGGNTALGNAAMFNSSTGGGNVAVGSSALGMNSSGSNNVAVGSGALLNNYTGTNNTALGTSALDSYGGTNNTALGYNADVNASGLTNATAVGNGAIVNLSNRVWLGNSVADVWTSNSYNISDKRFKSNIISEDVKGLDFINLLRPVVYNFEAKKLTEFLTKNMPPEKREKYLNENFDKKTAVRQTGFIAQEVEIAAKKSGFNFSGVHIPENDNDTYGIAYSEFVVPLVKGMQEQQAMIEDLKTANALQQQQIEELLNKATTGIGTIANGVDGFALSQNVPNPFTSETVIKYTLSAQTNLAVLNVYDLSGKQIASFPLTEKGSSFITLTSEKLAAGIYIYSVVADGKIIDSKRMVVSEK